MNRNYGRLVGGEVEFAPAKITKDDGTVVICDGAHDLQPTTPVPAGVLDEKRECARIRNSVAPESLVRRIEVANLITLSEGLRLGMDGHALRARLIPRET